jgi:ATP-dependent exoDNAse (exonuclease V) beta subunit
MSVETQSTGAVMGWINHVFGELTRPAEGSQPEFRPLRAVRPDAPGGPPVVVLGTEVHPKHLNAAELRTHDAEEVVAALRTALADRWQVADGAGGWRDVTLPDIAILLPTRTSLPQLEAALDQAGIGYHAEASSLVYRTSEVRDLLAAARAVDDPSDELSLVTALRSRMFGCGDDDLWTWRRAGGRWNITATAPETVAPSHPVAQAMAYLRRLHYDAAWLAPSEVLARLVDDRRLLGSRSTGCAPRRVAAAAVRGRPGAGVVGIRARRVVNLSWVPAGQRHCPWLRRCCRRPTPTRCGS